MSHVITSTRPDPLARKATLTGLIAVGLLAIFGLAGGAILDVALFALSRMNFSGWQLTGFDVPAVLFAGMPAVLAAGWAMLALWQMGNHRWVVGGLVALPLGVAVALIAGIMPQYQLTEQVAGVLGTLEALVAGVWLADMFGSVTHKGVLAGLAADIYLLMGFLIVFQGQQPVVLSFVLGLLVACPLLAVAILGEESEKGPRLRKRPLTWLIVGMLVLPVAAGLGFQLAGLVAPY